MKTVVGKLPNKHTQANNFLFYAIDSENVIEMPSRQSHTNVSERRFWLHSAY